MKNLLLLFLLGFLLGCDYPKTQKEVRVDLLLYSVRDSVKVEITDTFTSPSEYINYYITKKGKYERVGVIDSRYMTWKSELVVIPKGYQVKVIDFKQQILK